MNSCGRRFTGSRRLASCAAARPRLLRLFVRPHPAANAPGRSSSSRRLPAGRDRIEPWSLQDSVFLRPSTTIAQLPCCRGVPLKCRLDIFLPWQTLRLRSVRPPAQSLRLREQSEGPVVGQRFGHFANSLRRGPQFGLALGREELEQCFPVRQPVRNPSEVRGSPAPVSLRGWFSKAQALEILFLREPSFRARP